MPFRMAVESLLMKGCREAGLRGAAEKVGPDHFRGYRVWKGGADRRLTDGARTWETTELMELVGGIESSIS